MIQQSRAARRGGYSIADYVEGLIACGHASADILDWPDAEKRDPVAAIESARRDFLMHHWTWVEEQHEFRKNGWRVFFRPQGKLAPPVCQWDRIGEEEP